MNYSPTRDLSTAIHHGFLRLLSLNLAYAPDRDVIATTEAAWIDACRDECLTDNDADRVALGFRWLARTSRTWPAPLDLFNALPPRRRDVFRAIKPPQVTPEQEAAELAQRRETLSKVRAMLSPLLNRMTGRHE